METQSEILRALVIIITAAAAGGMLASLVRLPAILGYLLAGVVVAQVLPGGEIDPSQVRDIAELGVALLLFTLGLQFSFFKFSGVRRAAIIGWIAQITLTIALGVLLDGALGFGRTGSLVLGSAMALSSTMVALTLMDPRNEVSTLHGRMPLGVLLVQDLAVVPLVILLTTLAGGSQDNLPVEFGLAAVEAAGLLLAAYLLGCRGLPWLLPRVARRGFPRTLSPHHPHAGAGTGRGQLGAGAFDRTGGVPGGAGDSRIGVQLSHAIRSAAPAGRLRHGVLRSRWGCWRTRAC